ncbi:hypothetical protein ZD86_02180 [Salmonella enterica subsp. enterica]|nr:hypothetical protein [Salmonella enterica subsp. enterica serovar Poona]EBW2889641.1 hypothetical protein [Salmonella enterica subsp. enterica serovar Poona]ECD3711260.1 hypothetical protein [Salmonella enterica subsp. enterica serovar Poona]ECG6029160.1 hypothetical protein [Salmonella enterica subsp. enterica serovar Poona]ECH9318885.1 hypothetical protein [Salmonella enterica subsp. enterica serovar Poona]
MAAINIPDIYGRFHLVNFDNVNFIEISDREENGDLIIHFTNQEKRTVSAGRDRDGAIEVYQRICAAISRRIPVPVPGIWR